MQVLKLGPAAAAASTAAAAASAAASGGALGAARKLLSTAVLQGVPAATAAPTASISMNATAASVAEGQQQGLSVLLTHVALPLILGVGIIALVVQNGKHLVNKPQLCPQLAVTVRKPSSKEKAA